MHCLAIPGWIVLPGLLLGAFLSLGCGDNDRRSAAPAESSSPKTLLRPNWLPPGCAGAELLYENTFSAAPEQRRAEADKDWVMEGGGTAEWADGRLVLRPKRYTASRSRVETDHFVYWLKRDFPAGVAVEWDFRYPAPDGVPNGLAILFICARGVGGEDLFDPKLAKRKGVFRRYHSGDINSYHLSYFAGRRGTVNVRKNRGFRQVASGPDLVAKGGADKWHHLRLVRFKGLLQLTVDEQPCIRWTDDGTVGGPPHGGGKIGLRQQNNLRRGEYANLRVYGLKARP